MLGSKEALDLIRNKTGEARSEQGSRVMDADTAKRQFTKFNLDPALAEAIEAAPEQQIIEGILRLEDPSHIPPQFIVVSQFIRICTGRFLAAHAWTIRLHPNVVSLKAARPIGIYQCCENPHEAEPVEMVQPTNRPLPFTGRGCIVAALDFGLDFTHPNFLNPDGTTRLTAFWHQGATYDAAYPNRYGYGRVFSRDEIDAALRASDPYRDLSYHPAISDTGNGSHGTHTLDIAAGNGRAPGSRAGVAPNADLLFVHLSTPRLGSVGDLGDSVRMLEALDFVNRTAGDRPWVVNISVGRTVGSHDGTSPFEQGMHELLRLGSGRAIVQSAGNYRSANLAVEGWLRDGEHRDLRWIIDPRDTTPNEIDAWYSGNDRFVVALQSPKHGEFVDVRLGEVVDITHDGDLVGRVYHRKNDPNNRDNHIDVFLYPGAPPGVWTLRLIGEYVINGRFHAWIERDLASPGAQSRFDEQITSQSYTLGTIATSPLVITVGAYDANSEGGPLAPFSSCGPTRDERHDKPELLAPGVRVVAARSTPRGAVQQEGLLVARSGTSMAAPHVTGTVAAMFEAAGRPLSIDEVRDCLKRSAEPVTDIAHADCCAWGRLNTAEAISRIRDLKEPALVPAPEGDFFAPAAWVMTTEPAISDAATDDISSASDGREIELSLDTGALMTSNAAQSFLDRAEHALRSSYGGRLASETSFLERLLRELEGNVSVARLSPAALFRAALRGRPLMNHARNVLEVFGVPSQRPEGELHPGDWILRAVPGTGDVGHVSVLASGDLLTPSAIAAGGIPAESLQPGHYGLVVEAGPFPHNRSQPFARRLLDSRGRVPPHTLVLRPRFPSVGEVEDLFQSETGIHETDPFVEDVPEGLVTDHLWQEWHAGQAPTRYAGPTADDRRVVERAALTGLLVSKARLHLCFLERAVATFAANVTGADYWAKWEIVDSSGAVVREHPTFSRAHFDARRESAKLTTGQFGWMWDGRNKARDPVFVSAGVYRSRVTVKDSTGSTRVFIAQVELDGDPYTILIVGQPKNEVDLAAALAHPPGGAAWSGRLLNRHGQRIGNDCWLKVFRGVRNNGHVVFLGHGTIEATQVEGPPRHGAIQTPHGIDYKGWIRRDPHGVLNQPDRVQIEDVGSSNERISLPSSLAEPVSNPYTDDPSQGAFKDGVQAHAGNVETTNGLSVGCTTACPISGHTCADPGAETDGVRSINSSFGTWGGRHEDARHGGPPFVNKQNKHGIADALLADDHDAPLLDPAGSAACGGGPDEPLHMQETVQRAVFGGFKGHEIPLSSLVADSPGGRLRIRMRLESYRVGSRYHVYHHAVGFGHAFELVGRDLTVQMWIPSKVIRGWNGNRRNVLVRGSCQISWTLEHVPAGETGRVVLHRFAGTAASVFVDLANADIGRAQRVFRLPNPAPSRPLFSVFRYRLQLLPFAIGTDTWVAEDGYPDSLSPHTANLSRESLLTTGASRIAAGQNELEIY
jgi:subtilisin family serine protease